MQFIASSSSRVEQTSAPVTVLYLTGTLWPELSQRSSWQQNSRELKGASSAVALLGASQPAHLMCTVGDPLSPGWGSVTKMGLYVEVGGILELKKGKYPLDFLLEAKLAGAMQTGTKVLV